jgi:hypothetical protein
MRHAAQCVGRVLRGKTDWGLMIFADKVRPLLRSKGWADEKRFALQNKRDKLPKWINQYITEAHSNLSTDMGTNLAKKFIRQISQPFDHTQTGISLWTVEDIEAKQRKDAEENERAMREAGGCWDWTSGYGAYGFRRWDWGWGIGFVGCSGSGGSWSSRFIGCDRRAVDDFGRVVSCRIVVSSSLYNRDIPMVIMHTYPSSLVLQLHIST